MSAELAPKQDLTVLQARMPAAMQASEENAILSMIERAARDPSIDLDRLERLMKLRDDTLTRNAKVAFDAAFSEMQRDLPTIDQNGRINITHKADADKEPHQRRVIQSTAFAKFEDINDAVKPILATHGFGLSFRTGLSQDGRVTVTAILSHRAGHREETTMVLPHDSTGSKNNVQAIGSSTSYGRRYTTLALLNITSRLKEDRDDDGQAAGRPDTISEEEAASLREDLFKARGNLTQFCDHFKIEDLDCLPAKRLDEARRMIAAKAAASARGAAR